MHAFSQQNELYKMFIIRTRPMEFNLNISIIIDIHQQHPTGNQKLLKALFKNHTDCLQNQTTPYKQ